MQGGLEEGETADYVFVGVERDRGGPNVEENNGRQKVSGRRLDQGSQEGGEGAYLAKRDKVGGTPGAGCHVVRRSYWTAVEVVLEHGYSAKVA